MLQRTYTAQDSAVAYSFHLDNRVSRWTLRAHAGEGTYATKNMQSTPNAMAANWENVSKGRCNGTQTSRYLSQGLLGALALCQKTTQSPSKSDGYQLNSESTTHARWQDGHSADVHEPTSNERDDLREVSSLSLHTFPPWVSARRGRTRSANCTEVPRRPDAACLTAAVRSVASPWISVETERLWTPIPMKVLHEDRVSVNQTLVPYPARRVLTQSGDGGTK